MKKQILLSFVFLCAAAIVNAAIVTLDWQDNSGDEEGFKVWRQTPGGTDWSPYAIVGPDVTTYTDALSDLGYCYRVNAFIGALESDFTNAVCVTSAGSPENLTLSPIDVLLMRMVTQPVTTIIVRRNSAIPPGMIGIQINPSTQIEVNGVRNPP